MTKLNNKESQVSKNVKFRNEDKSFLIPHETWHNVLTPKALHKHQFIRIGFYKPEGTDGEFLIEWDELGMRLKAYDDSWEAMSHMPELMALLAEISKNKKTPSLSEFAEQLKELGYRDITERENPNVRF